MADEEVTDLYPDFCIGRPDGNYPHPDPDLPDKMISCVNHSRAYERTIPAGMHFDAEGNLVAD